MKRRMSLSEFVKASKIKKINSINETKKPILMRASKRMQKAAMYVIPAVVATKATTFTMVYYSDAHLSQKTMDVMRETLTYDILASGLVVSGLAVGSMAVSLVGASIDLAKAVKERVRS